METTVRPQKTEWDISPARVSGFAELVDQSGDIDIDACYQCRKCVTGCAVAYAMDYTPLQILHAVRLGLEDLVLQSSAIWLCVSSATCVTRCPQDVDIPRMMDSLRTLALERGIEPKEPEVAAFYRSGLRNVRVFGRLYELGLVGQLKLATRQFTRDLELGKGMFRRGKLKLLPHLGSLGKAGRIFSRVQKQERK